ncbi:cytochrome P450 [Nocardiopsis sp. FR6]|uniref:cytochrome P450 n=1 Tax=Nocardiopsis sp. FR6 TaxID=2605986 RepID=UPI001359E287|nr:cytochrome P450 [Nocardiopsis sp. FR6]
MNATADQVSALPPVPEAEPGSAGAPCAYAALRTERSITRVRLPGGQPVWLVSRYADVREALAHPGLVRPVIATWPPQDAEPWPRQVLTLLELRGDSHKRVRGAVAPAFTPRRMEALAPRIRAVANELIDELLREGPPGDLIAGFTEPFPLRVLCEFLGVDHTECAAFTEHTETVLDATRVPLERTLRALDALRDFAADLVDECQRGRGHGLLGQLARAPQGEGGLGRDDLISVTISMLIAGYKTNVQHFGSALPTLLERPWLVNRLRARPDQIPDAVEELLRHVPLMNAVIVLVATEDLDLGGRHIREGEAVMPVIASANRDGGTFAQADEFDPERTPNPHLTFGRGPHYCPGGHLTRMQLRIALETLLTRLPGLRPHTAVNRLEWDEDAPLRAPLRLPVRWDQRPPGLRDEDGARP